MQLSDEMSLPSSTVQTASNVMQLKTGQIRRYDERDSSDDSASNIPSDSDCDSDNARDRTSDSASEADNDRTPKRARIDNGVPIDFIPPFSPDEVGRKYAVVKGVQPGIYNDW